MTAISSHRLRRSQGSTKLLSSFRIALLYLLSPNRPVTDEPSISGVLLNPVKVPSPLGNTKGRVFIHSSGCQSRSHYGKWPRFSLRLIRAGKPRTTRRKTKPYLRSLRADLIDV